MTAARAHHPSFDVPRPVLGYIAKTVTHNGRDLEGALNRLLAHNKLTGHAVTLEMAEREVRESAREAYRWSYAGERRLRGIREPVPLFRARRLAESGA